QAGTIIWFGFLAHGSVLSYSRIGNVQTIQRFNGRANSRQSGRNRAAHKAPYASAFCRANPIVFRAFSDRARIRRSLSSKRETRSSEKSPFCIRNRIALETRVEDSCQTPSCLRGAALLFRGRSL